MDLNDKQESELPDLCRSIAESSPMPMVAVDGPGHIIRYVNPVFCLLTGKTREELIRTTFRGVVPAGDECLLLLDRVYETGQAELYTGQEDSAPHPLYWSYAMWPVCAAEGRMVGVVFQVIETSHFHEQATAMNQALMVAWVRQHELTEQAETLNEQLRRANEALKQFAFAASHDLQEPLRMMTSYSQLLVKGFQGQLYGEAAHYVDFISKSARHMRNLLADLLSYAEAGLERGEIAERIDLKMIFGQVKENLEGKIAESSAVVTSDPLPHVEGQAAYFVQIFQNLIGNAIKYRGERSPRIHISAEERNGGWRFAVADNGMGIDPKHHEIIFAAFKRLHGPRIPGTGMGLAICQRVVERYSGRIWVESELNKGATFYFTLPKSE